MMKKNSLSTLFLALVAFLSPPAGRPAGIVFAADLDAAGSSGEIARLLQESADNQAIINNMIRIVEMKRDIAMAEYNDILEIMHNDKENIHSLAIAEALAAIERNRSESSVKTISPHEQLTIAVKYQSEWIEKYDAVIREIPSRRIDTAEAGAAPRTAAPTR